MQLELSFSGGWRVADANDRRVAIAGDVVVAFGPLASASDVWPLAIDVPPGAHVRVLGQRALHTRDGWPLTIVDAELVGAADAERRWYACYRFLAHGAVAVARAPSLDALEARHEELLAVFTGGRPSWRGPPICVHDALSLGAGIDVDERVIERFALDDHDIEAIEILRPRDPACRSVFELRALRDGRIEAAVTVETSARARDAGTPYVIGVAAPTYRAVTALRELPPYTELKAKMLPLLVDALSR